jgi:hypothetical protein
LSFFDEGDEPRTSTGPRQRRPAGRDAGGDQQQLMVRRAVAGGVGLVVLILLVVGVNGCLQSQREAALRDYTQEVASIISASDEQVAAPLFEALQDGTAPLERQQRVNQLRVLAEEQVRRASEFDVPGGMAPAQQSLLTVLDLRAGAVAEVARLLPSALRGGGSEAAVQALAGQMQALLASDVLYDARTAPFIGETLEQADLGGQEVPDSAFMPDLAWLDPSTVAQRIGSQGGGEGGSPRGEAAPGTHGHGLTSVAIGDTTLQPGGAVNRVPAGPGLAFTVVFQNQGENDEADFPVRVALEGGGGRPLTVEDRVDQTQAGQEATVTIPLEQMPPVGEPLTATVTVAPVPGEDMTENNQQEYTVLFTQ